MMQQFNNSSSSTTAAVQLAKKESRGFREQPDFILLWGPPGHPPPHPRLTEPK
jgi:hypothetical protein